MKDDDKYTKLVVHRIKKLRKALGWSQSELARQANVTSAAISQIEKGGRMPSLTVVRRLAKALNIPIAHLTNDNDSTEFIYKDKQVFLMKFGDINKLSSEDQKLIMSLVKRLQND